MTRSETTRRTFIASIGAVLSTAVVPSTVAAASSGSGSEDGWAVVESPTGNTLYDVEATNAGTYTVGGGGIVLARTPDGWKKVLERR